VEHVKNFEQVKQDRDEHAQKLGSLYEAKVIDSQGRVIDRGDEMQ
jgi:hypothetical protein